MTTTIPEDIVDEIMEIISEDSISLRSCSLVSRVFRVPCQRRLFRSINLDTAYGGPGVHNERLHLNLLNNPVLASFILSMRIHVAREENLRPGGAPLKVVCEILQMVRSHVREVALRAQSNLPWKSLPESLQTALLDVMAQCATITIRYHVGLPITYLTQLSHLRHLSLTASDSVTIPDEGSSYSGLGEPSTRTQAYLESLSVTPKEAAPHILQALHNPRQLCSLSLSRLKVLKICMLPSRPLIRDIGPIAAAIKDIIYAAAHCLEEIRLHTILDSHLDLSRLTHLRNLDLGFDCTPDLQPSVCHAIHFIRESEKREIDALLAQERYAAMYSSLRSSISCEHGPGEY
ncbi:hypothetical protein FPV67DRAFT_1663910 [Lyophyllum atratum]|nr:hypothetical protein FPV67DRAFT_1663910 [Lyophyllum atratum]